MRFTKFLLCVMVVFLIFSCSCIKQTEGFENETFSSENTGGNKEMETSSSNKTLIDLATKAYDDSELLEITQFSGSIKELDFQYPIECLREDSGLYRVSYLGSAREHIAVLWFDNSGNKVLGRIHGTRLINSDFEELSKGDVLEDVRDIDPNGEYLFLYTGRNDTPRISYHYTKDGYLIAIEYDASNVIVNINKALI